MSMSKSEIASIIRKAANRLESQPVHVTCMSHRKDPESGVMCFCAGGCIGVELSPNGVNEGSPYGCYRNTDVSRELESNGTATAGFNDTHSKDETVAYMRARADDIDPPKAGSKRFLAKLYRDGAAFLETHTRGRHWLHRNGEYCAFGSIAASVIGEGRPEPEYSDALDVLFCGNQKLHWDQRSTFGLETVAASALFGVKGCYSLTLVSDMTHTFSKADVCKLMRTVAYMLEHGGKLPPGVGKYAATRNAVKGVV